VPVYAVYAAISLALMAGVGIWAGAYRLGWSAGERETLDRLELVRPGPRPDPLRDAAQVNGWATEGGDGAERAAGPDGLGEGGLGGLGVPEPDAGRSSGSPNVPDNAAEGRGDDPGAGRLVLGHRGRVIPDPRRSETNYLKIESGVPREEAVRLLRFLASRGIEAIAVGPGLDRGGPGADNGGRVSVYSLRGIASSQWSRQGDRAREHLELVRRLGREWRSTHGGTVALADPLWEKFGG